MRNRKTTALGLMAVLVELCTFSPGIQQLTCTYYLPPGIQIEEETVPLLAALPVQFNRRSPQSGLGGCDQLQLLINVDNCYHQRPLDVEVRSPEAGICMMCIPRRICLHRLWEAPKSHGYSVL